MKKLILNVLFLFCIVASAFAQDTYYVNDVVDGGEVWTSTPGNDGTGAVNNPLLPYLTLKAAVLVAVSGDIIRIDEGTYTDFWVDFSPTVGTTTLTLEGAGATKTIFDPSTNGANCHRRQFSSSTYSYDLTVSDITFTNYQPEAPFALDCFPAHASPDPCGCTTTSGPSVFSVINGDALTLIDVIVSNSTDWNAPAAINVSPGSGTATLTVTRGGFFCNENGAIAVSGGGTGSSSLTLTDVAFINNSGFSNDYGSAVKIGGAVSFADSSPDDEANMSKIKITGCRFEDNTSTKTSAVYINSDNTSATASNYGVEDCVFRNNTSTSSGTSYGGCLSFKNKGTTLTVDHCLFENNTNADALGTLASHSGNLTVNQCRFTGNTTTASEGSDMYFRAPSATQKASPYFFSNTSVTVTQCFMLDAGDRVTRNTSTNCTVNLTESGSPDATADYTEVGSNINTYTWVAPTEPTWTGSCAAGFSSCTDPTTAATTLAAGSITNTTADITWVKSVEGSTNTLIVLKAGSAPTDPIDNAAAYTANTAMGSGSDLGASSFVVAADGTQTVSVTNLLPNTTYYVEAWTYFNGTLCYIGTNANITFTTPKNYYYVNDAQTGSETWCSALGQTVAGGATGTTALPYISIQECLDDNTLTANDIIRIDHGTYNTTDENAIEADDDLDFTIEGAGSDKVTLDPPSANSHAFIFVDDGDITISGIKIKDANVTTNATKDDGVALYFELTTAVTKTLSLTDVIISNCTSSYGGAGAGAAIYTYLGGGGGTAHLTISSSEFFGNTAVGTGGAIHADGGSSQVVTISTSKFYSNASTENSGSAINIKDGTSTITNCLFYKNDVVDDGVNGTIFYNLGGTHTINHSTLAYNDCGTGSAGVNVGNGLTLNLENSILYGNTNADIDQDGTGVINCDESNYGTLQGSLTLNTNNITTDPLFVLSGSDDYHILGSSPAKDNADNTDVVVTLDLDGETRADPDMGCYEGAGSIYWDGSTDNDWLTASNWSSNTVPTAGKIAVIPTSASYGDFPIIDEANAVCGTLSLLGDAYMQVASGKLTIGGTVDMASTSEIQFDGGELECTGQFNADGVLDINSGTLDIDNTLDISAIVTEELTGGTIEIEDDLTNTGGTWTPSGTNTITFDGNGNSVITDADGISFYNLTLNKDAIGQTLTCNSANDDITVEAAFTITQGTMTPTLGDFTVTGNTVLTAGKFIAIDAVSTFNGDVTLNNAAIMDHQGTPNLSTTEFIIVGNITLNGTSGLQSSTSTTDYLALTGVSKTISVNTAANSESINIYVSGGATYQLNNDWRIEKMNTSAAANVFTVATGNTLTIDDSFYQQAGSTLTLSGSANMNVGTTSSCAPEAGCIFNLNTGTLNVDGTTNLTGGTGTFNANTGIMLLAGDVTNGASGTFNCGTSLLKCDAAAATTIQMNGDAVYNLEVEKTSNGITPLSALDINGYLEIDDGDFDAATFTHTVAGDFITAGGTFTQNTSTINFDGGSTQAVNVTTAGGTTPNVATINFYNLTASGSDVRIYYDVSTNKVNVLNDLTISGKLINIEK